MQMQHRRAGIAAATDSSMICAGVSGRYGDWLGVWMEPVMAQVTMTGRDMFLRWQQFGGIASGYGIL